MMACFFFFVLFLDNGMGGLVIPKAFCFLVFGHPYLLAVGVLLDNRAATGRLLEMLAGLWTILPDECRG